MIDPDRYNMSESCYCHGEIVPKIDPTATSYIQLPGMSERQKEDVDRSLSARLSLCILITN